MPIEVSRSKRRRQSLQRSNQVVILLRKHSAKIAQDAAFFYAGDDWRPRRSQARGYFIRAQTFAGYGQQPGGQNCRGRGATANHRFAINDVDVYFE
jgi:hypothetical protein